MDSPTLNNSTPEIWQIDVAGQIYQADFAELTQWIAEGSLLRNDKVRRGNLRWIEAQKVPLLHGFFNAQDLGVAPPVIPILIVQSTPEPQAHEFTTQTFGQNQINYPQSQANLIEIAETNFCLVHIDTKPKFICDACTNVFCGECPQSYSGTVKICPMCGGMCNPIGEVVEKEQKTVAIQQAGKEGFGLIDFGRALIYPFKFKTSFFFGALFYVFFTIGQQASAMGGYWLIGASIICWMLTNMLNFGILANTVENMLEGKINRDFMPNFDDFSLWDDVIHPLFLVSSTYLVSFGAFAILCLAMMYFVTNSITTDINSFQKPNVADQQTNNEIPKVIVLDDEKQMQQVNEMINKTRQQQLESTAGKQTNEAESTFAKQYKLISTWGTPFIFLIGITILWGIFYYPVALIVAAYTRNISCVVNPLVGLDTIRRLGFDYVKILLMGFLLLALGWGISLALSAVFASFNLPRLGNIPATIVGSVFTFYLSIVFSTIIGFALYKNLNSFNLYSTKNTQGSH